MDVAVGSIIDGKYRVDRVLGRGGMGMIVGATHTALEERVAIKLLLREALEEPENLLRFSREARAAVKIKSEHVARVIDVGALGDGTPFIVMEHLDGRDLAAVLQERGRLPIPEAIDFVLQACEAIAEAHVLGIVHRDLKPSNLFLTRRNDGTPLVKVLDFGVSKLLAPGPGGALTRTTDVVGSPLYMSPEQMLSAKHVDSRSDVWALGVIGYELLTGKVPFVAETLAALCAQVLQIPAPPIVAERPEVPRGLEQAIFRCLAKDPAQRFANVAELARSLAPFAPAASATSVERIARIAGNSLETQRAPPPTSAFESPSIAASAGGITTPLSTPPTLHVPERPPPSPPADRTMRSVPSETTRAAVSVTPPLPRRVVAAAPAVAAPSSAGKLAVVVGAVVVALAIAGAAIVRTTSAGATDGARVEEQPEKEAPPVERPAASISAAPAVGPAPETSASVAAPSSSAAASAPPVVPVAAPPSHRAVAPKTAPADDGADWSKRH